MTPRLGSLHLTNRTEATLLLLAILALAAPPAPLDLGELTRAVVEGNPDAIFAAAALSAARADARAAGPWPDPMVDLSIAPLSVAEMPGWQVQIRQDLPTWGERRAAREMAGADASAAAARLDMMRFELADMAAMAWTDWYAVHRQLDLVARTGAVLADTRATALSRVAAGRATDLDVLQVDAELAALAATGRRLAAERDVVAVRLNTLLHRPAVAEVAPPPASLARPLAPGPGGARPELAESAAMVDAADAQVRMTRADRLPMLGVMTGWDAMQAMPEDRWMAGVSVSVPLDRPAGAARVDAASARADAARAEAARTDDRVAQQLATAERRFAADSDVLDILDGQLLPVARSRVSAARAGFSVGSVDVRQLLDAERALLEAESRRAQQLALVVLRARELELARGILEPGATP